MSVYQLLADAVLALHLAVVVFVVGGQAAVVVGNLRGWRWVNDLGFRLGHLGAIGFVVAQAWLGATCPLTSLEMWLREQASPGSGYSGSFVGYWIARILFYDAAPWVFVVVYTAFGALVLASWWHFPPQRRPAAGRPRHQAGD